MVELGAVFERLESPVPRVILHLDMDAFFASVEQADNPALRGLPVIVGGEHRGVVSAASYEARRFGVHSAMPTSTAHKLCPGGVFLRGRHERYAEVSGRIMAILRSMVPVVEQTSVDEAYMDATGMERLAGSPRALAAQLKAAIRAETDLSCSVGIAPNKFLAKIASELDKPDGLAVIEPEHVPELLRTLPVAKLPGIGPRTQAVLQRFGVRVAADVCNFPVSFWAEKLGSWGPVLYARAQGIDDRPLCPDWAMKSSSAENTLEADTLDRELLKAWLQRQAERVGRDLRDHGLFGRTVTLKVKFADFTGLTRSRSLARATNRTKVIFATAAALLDDLSMPRAVRLIGLGVSNFADGPDQGLLIPGLEPEADTLDLALDAIRSRHGNRAVVVGRMFDMDRHRGEPPDSSEE